MSYPSRQKELYEKLERHLRENFGPGCRLEPEEELAKLFHCAKETIHPVMLRLKEEGRIVRTRGPKGTFVSNPRNPFVQKNETEPITLLVPCSDFSTKVPYLSNRFYQDMILYAREVAVRHGTYLVTIPVSDFNDPERINWVELSHLKRSSRVMFSSLDWFKAVLPLFKSLKCRLAIYQGSSCCCEVPKFFAAKCILENDRDFQLQAIQFLHSKGARRIVFFSNGLFIDDVEEKKLFLKKLKDSGLPSEDSMYITRKNASGKECLSLLKELYEKYHFDGIVWYLGEYGPAEDADEFYKKTGIPLETKQVFLNSYPPKNFHFGPNSWVSCSDVRRNMTELAEFLFSSETGIHIVNKTGKLEKLVEK